MVAERCHSSDFAGGVHSLLNSLNSLSLQSLKPLSDSLNLIFLCLIYRYFSSQAIFALLYFTLLALNQNKAENISIIIDI